MSPLPGLIEHALHRLPRTALCVGFSGGLDSTVLLHLLALAPAARERGLRAVHVHHGLHPRADEWIAHCEAVCGALAVPLVVSRVAVPRDSGLGLEGAARQARREAFAKMLGAGEVLALAHHRDDQAETFLLRALRASGPDGLAAMRPWGGFGHGHLWRPLLDTPRARLVEYATHHGLHWIEDPANGDEAFDRNFLRRKVLPLLAERWAHAPAALAASAGLCGDAAALLDGEDARALADVAYAHDGAVLSRSRLRDLPPARRARVLRRWIRGLGLPPLPAGGIAQAESTLLPARADAAARYEWAGAVLQAWRDQLHAGPVQPPFPDEWQACWDGAAPLPLPDGGTLRLVAVARIGAGGASADGSCAGSGSLAATFDPPFTVHPRRGGERITLPGRGHSHSLKHVLQDAGIPPWQRGRLPLLSSADGELLAAGDRIVSVRLQHWLAQRSLRLELHYALPRGHHGELPHPR
jgi:tRNA(Ile)-lysidine synthase